MNSYKVETSEKATMDIKRLTDHLLYDKQNPYAAKSVFDDFFETAKRLSYMADVIRTPDDTKLRSLGLKRMNFLKHDYFMLFKIQEDTVMITNVFHSLEDYQNKM